MFSDPEIISMSLYMAQAIFAGFITTLVYHFFKVYGNNFFRCWTLAWLAFCIHSGGLAAGMFNSAFFDLTHPISIAITSITVTAGLIQGIFLFMGFFALHTRQNAPAPNSLIVLGGGFLMSLVLVSMGAGDPSAIQIRDFGRLAVKELITGLGFAGSALLIFSKSWKAGRLQMAIVTFLCFAVLQLIYFGFHLTGLIEGRQMNIPNQLVIFDFLLIVLIGLGMIMGVLEIERYRLKKVNKQLDTFLYRSAHDLRTPIVDILGILELIKLDDTDNRDEYHELIRSQVVKADEVIKDIITLREGQKHVVHKSKVDVQSIFNQIRSELVIRYPYAQKLRFEYIQDHNESVNTDGHRLKAILSYLLSNAVQYHDYKKSDPYVSVANQKVKSGFKLTIADNGSGIEENQQGRIFKMFHRANKTSGGSGLGLYIVKEAVEQLGGNVALKSKVEEGTSVEIVLH